MIILKVHNVKKFYLQLGILESMLENSGHAWNPGYQCTSILVDPHRSASFSSEENAWIQKHLSTEDYTVSVASCTKPATIKRYLKGRPKYYDHKLNGDCPVVEVNVKDLLLNPAWLSSYTAEQLNKMDEFINF